MASLGFSRKQFSSQPASLEVTAGEDRRAGSGSSERYCRTCSQRTLRKPCDCNQYVVSDCLEVLISIKQRRLRVSLELVYIQCQWELSVASGLVE